MFQYSVGGGVMANTITYGQDCIEVGTSVPFPTEIFCTLTYVYMRLLPVRALRGGTFAVGRWASSYYTEMHSTHCAGNYTFVQSCTKCPHYICASSSEEDISVGVELQVLDGYYFWDKTSYLLY